MNADDKTIREAYMLRFDLIKQRYPHLEVPSRDHMMTIGEYREKYSMLCEVIRKEWKDLLNTNEPDRGV
jgi:hypothetical protein